MPADYVHKLARMFQDIKISEDLNQQFKEEYRKTKGTIAGKLPFQSWWSLAHIHFVFFFVRQIPLTLKYLTLEPGLVVPTGLPSLCH